MGMTALALVLLAKAPLDGCTITGPAPGADRKIRCSDAKVFVSPPGAKSGTDGLVQGFLSMLRKEDAAAKIEPLTVDGKKLPGVRFAKGRAVVIPSGDEQIRTVACESTKPGRCEELISLLLSGLPEATPAQVDAGTPAASK